MLLLNVAVAVTVPVPDTTHVVPPHDVSPPHPPNVEFVPGVSVSVTLVSAGKFAVHPVVDPLVQFIPDGLLVTVPLPVPNSVITSVNVLLLNVAVTLSAALIVIVQLPVPLHCVFPLHPANVLPLPAVAVSVTVLPLLKFPVHVVGQLIPVPG